MQIGKDPQEKKILKIQSLPTICSMNAKLANILHSLATKTRETVKPLQN